MCRVSAFTVRTPIGTKTLVNFELQNAQILVTFRLACTVSIARSIQQLSLVTRQTKNSLVFEKLYANDYIDP